MSRQDSSSEHPVTIHVALVDAVPGAQDAVGEWFDTDHAAAILATGRWRRIRRFACVQDATLSLAVYEPAGGLSPSTPLPAAFRSELGRRSIRSYLADTFVEVARFGTLTADPQHINAIALQVSMAGRQEFDDWYNLVHAPEIIACPGWLGVRRFHSMHEPARFLAVYDLADPITPFASAEYDAAVGWDGLDRHLLGYHGWRTYQLASSSTLDRR